MQIKNWRNGNVIIDGDYKSAKEAVEDYIKKCREKGCGANLRRADLSGANLRRADLSGADLSGADLSGANLSGADLSRADLSGAYLSGANLSWADLSRAELSWAELSGADLSRAYLSGADLSGADLSGADLSGADLSGADIKNIPHFNTPTVNEYIKKYKIKRNGEYIYLYKGLSNDYKSPIADNKIEYKTGKTIKCDFPNSDPWTQCGAGLNVSPTFEAAQEFAQGLTIRVKVHIGDIACIPIYGHESKIRVKKLKCLAKVTK